MPGLADALKQPAAAVAAPAAKAVTAGPASNGGNGGHAAPQQAPAPRAEAPAPTGGVGPAKQPANAKSGKGDDDEWWTQ
jgi:hypothetical protein